MPAAGELLQIAQGQMLHGLLHPVGPGGGLGQQSCSDLSLLRSQTLGSSHLALGPPLESDSISCATDLERKILSLDFSALESRPCPSQTNMFCSSARLSDLQLLRIGCRSTGSWLVSVTSRL